jgi:hypothetical protein
MNRILTLATILALTVVPAASAGSPQAGYGGSGGSIQGTVQKAGELPFTGLSLTVFAIGALLLVGVGLFLRRSGRAS